jgi:hypothetical protein
LQYILEKTAESECVQGKKDEGKEFIVKKTLTWFKAIQRMLEVALNDSKV